MGGTVEGGLKTAETNTRKYGADYYKRIGSKGGKRSSNKRTHCMRGHLFTPENEHMTHGRRTCKICYLDSMKRRRIKRDAVKKSDGLRTVKANTWVAPSRPTLPPLDMNKRRKNG
jgi:hypothetical protein